MPRKLLEVAEIHELPSDIASMTRRIDEKRYEKVEKKLKEVLDAYYDIIFDRIKNRRVDVIFHEGLADEELVPELNKGDFSQIVGLSAEEKEIYRNLVMKGARFEKTEDELAYHLHKLVILLRAIKPFRKLLKGLYEFFSNRRSYLMGKNISERLGVDKTGIVFYGAAHDVIGYVRLLAPDITIESIYSRKNAQKDFEKMISFIKKLYGI